MKNITLSADEELIERARRKAEADSTTLNNAFREWLTEYSKPTRLTIDDIRKIVAGSNFKAGRRFTRAERNER